MVTTVGDIFSIIDTISPFRLAEDWDNCGLQAGNLSWQVKKILVALDVSMAVMNYAVDSKSDLVITHHPLTIRPPKSIDFATMPGSAIEIAAKNKISIISAHTNLDKASGGLNDHFANILGLKNIRLLIPSADSFDNPVQNKTSYGNGLGRVGEVDGILPLKSFAIDVKKRFKLKTLRVVGNPESLVKQVAICTGSGGSLLKEFFKSKADVYVTGDIKYHEARDVEEAGLGLIDVGHFASEQIAVELICKKLEDASTKKGLNLTIEGFYLDSDPFVTLY
ncbi:MAG: Nif3-like dinuclear metal center hexameric protein [Desulfamplus sp.]|nr:Nif3-like dinuclear metal center hexameric protein [Desulfamplus sp.]MBF0390957.1 Nif3-like dinuclear metal center hexameric protein [Desulfamplus sp.]